MTSRDEIRKAIRKIEDAFAERRAALDREFKERYDKLDREYREERDVLRQAYDDAGVIPFGSHDQYLRPQSAWVIVYGANGSEDLVVTYRDIPSLIFALDRALGRSHEA